MADHSRTHVPISLRECARLLATNEHLGDRAPAYLTLKRWASSGLLHSARVMKPGAARPSYLLVEVERFALARRADSDRRRRLPTASTIDGQPKAFVVSAAGLVSQLPLKGIRQPSTVTVDAPLEQRFIATLGLISDTLVEIRDALSGKAQQDLAVSNGLANLEATRKMLMTKYDGESTTLKTKVAAHGAQTPAEAQAAAEGWQARARSKTARTPAPKETARPAFTRRIRKNTRVRTG